MREIPALSTHPAALKLLLPACLLLAFLVYLPGLSGGFIFDDVANITTNEALKIDSLSSDQLLGATFSNYSGVLKRPLSMLSFALNYYVADFSAYAFKLVNLLLHLANGATVFLLTLLILNAYQRVQAVDLSQQRVLLFGLALCLAWLVSPINLTSVLYVVQRMTSLSAFFTLWGMVIYCWARLRLADGKSGKRFILASLLCGVLAVFSKENGALLPLYLLALEITLFRFRAERAADSRFLLLFFAATVAVPGIIALALLLSSPELVLAGYHSRDFDVIQRLLTEARVLWFYIGMILLPSNRQLGLFHDDIEISRSLIEPLSTLPAVAGILIVLIGALFMIRRAPLFALGILLFFSGHLLESTLLPLEITHEHRNYLPSLGILLALFSLLLRLTPVRLKTWVGTPAVVLLLGTYSVTTLMRAQYWGDPFDHYFLEAAHHPNSARANTQVGILYSQLAVSQPDRQQEFYALAEQHLMKATRLRSNFNDGLYSLIDLNVKLDRPQDPALLDMLTRRLEHEPYMAGNVNWINYFAFTGDPSGPMLPPQQLNALIRASLRNPTMKGRPGAELLSIASKHALRNGDHEGAVYLVARAAAARPQDPRYRLHLVSLLIILNRFEDASQELVVAERDDHLGAHKIEIQKYRDILSRVSL